MANGCVVGQHRPRVGTGPLVLSLGGFSNWGNNPPVLVAIVDRYQRFAGKAAELERTGESSIPVGAREENTQ